MVIYRIQDSEGVGPYRSEYLNQWCYCGHNSSKHPTPQQEGLRFSNEWYCGFESMKQLRSWFSNGELRKLHRMGLKINRIEVELLREISS